MSEHCYSGMVYCLALTVKLKTPLIAQFLFFIHVAALKTAVYSQGYIWCICSHPLRITVQGPFYHPFTHLLRTYLIHVIPFYVLTMT